MAAPAGRVAVSEARAVSLPPPVGGWDVLNALADMPAQNAQTLVNWFPSADRVTTRRGWVRYATGLPAAVETLMIWHPPTGAPRMFAASGAGIYDTTAAGPVGAAAVSGLGSARWQWVQMNTAGGHFLIAANGTDAPQIYNGTTWANTSWTGSGLTLGNVAWTNIHQRRLWFGEAGTMRAWYLPVNSIAGAASFFDFGGLAAFGGSLIGMGTWTRDGGSGADDLAVFLTDQGEALVYSGTDPAQASEWTLQGVFRIGRPLGRRAMTRAGADLLVMTEDGFVALSSVLPVDRSQQSAAAVSAQINPVVTAQARDFAGSFGWQAFFYPSANMLMFNIPAAAGRFEQYVFNTVTRAPCRFTGIPAHCWALIDDVPYFGGAGFVARFDVGSTDDGADIRALGVQAPNAMGPRAQTKAFKRVRLTMQSEVPPAVGVDVQPDYDLSAPPPAPRAGVAPLARWDQARWDQALWAGEATWAPWRGVRGKGRMGALRVQVAAREAPVAWIATDVLVVPGGVL